MKRNINEDIKNRFRDIVFFNKCGSPVNFSFPVKQIPNWNIAKSYFSEEKWEYSTYEAGNELRDYLYVNKLEQHRLWNEYADCSTEFVNDELLIKIKKWQEIYNINSIFIDCVKSDLAHALIYQQYLVEIKNNLPKFYDRILSVYEAGHFPCGWDGTYPYGTLVVI